MVTQNAPKSSGLPEPRYPTWVLGWDRDRDLAELEKLLRIEVPQGQREKWPQDREENPQGQREQAHQPEPKLPESQRREDPQGESQEVPPGQRGKSPRTGAFEETGEGQEAKILLFSGGCSSQAQEEGNTLDIPGPLGNSLGEEMQQPGERGALGAQGRTSQQLRGQEAGPKQEAAGDPHPVLLLSPDAATAEAGSTRSSGQQKGPAATTGHPTPGRHLTGLQESAGNPEPEGGEAPELREGAAGEPRAAGAEAPEARKMERPRFPDVSAAQRASALQRLLELQGAARRRRGLDRELQRLRVRGSSGDAGGHVGGGRVAARSRG